MKSSPAMSRAENIIDKILSPQKMKNLLAEKSFSEMKIVFTNGCFDILHPGHIHLLKEARKLGDLLIVGLNSDSSVKRLKGPDRPVQDENSRALILASMIYVDYVVLFSEDTPLDLIKLISPDVLVKGGDYREDQIVGADFLRSTGGNTITIPFLEGHSSSSLIDKSKKK